MIFEKGLLRYSTYSHELGHMLGLQHTFSDDLQFVNNEIRKAFDSKNEKVNNIVDIENEICNEENRMSENEEQITKLEREIKETNDKVLIREKSILIKGKREDIASSKDSKLFYEEQRDKLVQEIELKESILSVYNHLKTMTPKGETDNYMDYNVKRTKEDYEEIIKYFSKVQVNLMRKEIKLYIK